MKTRKQSILIVEDETSFRRLLIELLDDNGYITYEAENGEYGQLEFDNHQPDLIITDIIMPGKEGIEFIRNIRAHNNTIPIIAMSGGSSNFTESYLRASRKLGANSVLQKPFRPKLLLSTIEELLTQD